MREPKETNRPAGQRGFTLTEMLIATLVVLVGLVAVAQLVPISSTRTAEIAAAVGVARNRRWGRTTQQGSNCGASELPA